MPMQSVADGGLGPRVDTNSNEGMDASAFVKPCWAKMYGIRQELTQLRRDAAREWPSIKERVDLNSALANLEDRAKSLLRDLEQHAPEVGATGRVEALRRAIAGFLLTYSERR